MKARVRYTAVLIAGIAVSLFGAQQAQSAPMTRTLIPSVSTVRHDSVPILGQYVVMLRSNTARTAVDKRVSAAANNAEAHTLAGTVSGTVLHSYSSVHGYSTHMSATAAITLANNPRVLSVTQDRKVTIAGTQTNPPSWGLDRIDSRFGGIAHMSNQYTYSTLASNVHAYVIDTGIRTTHTDFGGRATVGVDLVNDGNVDGDCNGHGTHVAGTIGGTKYGVAKGAQLVSVRVLDCAGSGDFSSAIAGIDWINLNAVRPAVVNMSISGPYYQPMNDALEASVALGIPYAVAAGNNFGIDGSNTCDSSPSSAVNAVSVGSSDISDVESTYSNNGPCMDIFAPGENITSASCKPHIGTVTEPCTSDTLAATISGTSMATPHVAGAMALYLATNPTATPATVWNYLNTQSTKNVITHVLAGTPNKLLYTNPGKLVTIMHLDSTPEPLKFGKTVTNTGYVTEGAGASGLSRIPAELWFDPAGTAAAIKQATITTDTFGNFHYSRTQTVSGRWSAVFRGNTYYLASSTWDDVAVVR